MSESDDPQVFVPPDVAGGLWANYADVFGDIEEATLDFIRLEPRQPSLGILVARVTLPASGIIRLRHQLERFS